MRKVKFFQIAFLGGAIALTQALSGCAIVKKLAGADIDEAQFAKAREAKAAETRANAAMALEKRLSTGDPIENADILIYLSETSINLIAKQYENTSGWLDKSTSYMIKKVDVKIKNGAAVATLGLIAKNSSWSVDVDLNMDCLLTLETIGGELAIKLEPFNISPEVKAGGLLSSADEIIKNLIKINLAKIGEQMPKIKFPLNYTNSFSMPESKFKINNKVNMEIYNPQRLVNYELKIKEVLFFTGKAFVAINIVNPEVKK